MGKLKRSLRPFICQAFTVYVASNMLVCAILFMPWALPRETVSGLLGRWRCGHRGPKKTVADMLAWVVDRIYFWEPNHCIEVYKCEAEARKVLYPEHPGAVP